jgi:tetratricopeptide (TPR) repeat protein
VLGERLGDRPAAVARLRAIPDEAPEAIAARGLEGRLRAQLGDPSGAALAFARMRERAGREPGALAWLDEAARFEHERGDLHAAQAHLAAAIGIAPGDAALAARYRAHGEQIAEAAGVHRPPAPDDAHTVNVSGSALDEAHTVNLAGPSRAAEAEAEAEPARFTIALDDDDSPNPDDAQAEVRIEALTRTLQGDPNNDGVVDELVALLSRLGRSMDLLALLSARLEDAPAERREALLPKHREVLETLEREARAAGREGEADLFKMAREAT